MRQTKFRGLRVEYLHGIHESKWKYGNLLNSCSIGQVGIGLDSYEYAEVVPESVGEFTGLTDKHGKPIFEGDVVTARVKELHLPAKGVVEFINGSFAVNAGKEFDEGEDYFFWFQLNTHEDFEIIGNIYEQKQSL